MDAGSTAPPSAPPAPASSAAQATARILLQTQAVLVRPEPPFVLTSGRKSPVYVDCRRLISFPQARARLMDLAVDLLADRVGTDAFDVIAGGETAGIPFAAWIAERLSLPMIYVRKQAKGFGRNARIEGVCGDGQRVLLVEDLATDGGSKLSFIDALREAGAQAAHCFVIFHYGIFAEGAAQLSDAGITLHALATWADVLAEAERGQTLPASAIAEVRAFLSDPAGWSDRA